jgi:hypothetical protein
VDTYELCESCFKKGHYPTSLTEDDFVLKTLSEAQWERLSRDINSEMEQSARAKPTTLTKERQQ